MGAYSTCPSCGENHGGSCDSKDLLRFELEGKIDEKEEQIQDLLARLERVRSHNSDLVRGTEYLTKRLGIEVERTDKAEKALRQLQNELGKYKEGITDGQGTSSH